MENVLLVCQCLHVSIVLGQGKSTMGVAARKDKCHCEEQRDMVIVEP
jgi:hypothetical protein